MIQASAKMMASQFFALEVEARPAPVSHQSTVFFTAWVVLRVAGKDLKPTSSK
jgi:hypothetical protein